MTHLSVQEEKERQLRSALKDLENASAGISKEIESLPDEIATLQRILQAITLPEPVEERMNPAKAIRDARRQRQ